MGKVYPYEIFHINLQGFNGRPMVGTAGQGLYLVFWWDSTPLGQMFIEVGEEMDDEAFQEKLITSINPAIEDYSTRVKKQVNESGGINGIEQLKRKT